MPGLELLAPPGAPPCRGRPRAGVLVGSATRGAFGAAPPYCLFVGVHLISFPCRIKRRCRNPHQKQMCSLVNDYLMNFVTTPPVQELELCSHPRRSHGQSATPTKTLPPAKSGLQLGFCSKNLAFLYCLPSSALPQMLQFSFSYLKKCGESLNPHLSLPSSLFLTRCQRVQAFRPVEFPSLERACSST